MSTAEIRGKLTPSEETAEDLLTSEIFDALGVLPWPWSSRWLSKAKTLDEKTLSDRLDGTPRTSEHKIIYWPWLDGKCAIVPGCEPDIVLYIDGVCILIEMKLFSGKSGSGMAESTDSDGCRKSILGDQLGRQWFAGKFLKSGKVYLEGARPIRDWAVVYVTRDYQMPVHDLEISVESTRSVIDLMKEEFSSLGDLAEIRDRLYWVNYEALYVSLSTQNRIGDGPPLIEKKLSENLLRLLTYKGFAPFEGLLCPSTSESKLFRAFHFEEKGTISWPHIDRSAFVPFQFRAGG